MLPLSHPQILQVGQSSEFRQRQSQEKIQSSAHGPKTWSQAEFEQKYTLETANVRTKGYIFGNGLCVCVCEMHLQQLSHCSFQMGLSQVAMCTVARQWDTTAKYMTRINVRLHSTVELCSMNKRQGRFTKQTNRRKLKNNGNGLKGEKVCYRCQSILQSKCEATRRGGCWANQIHPQVRIHGRNFFNNAWTARPRTPRPELNPKVGVADEKLMVSARRTSPSAVIFAVMRGRASVSETTGGASGQEGSLSFLPGQEPSAQESISWLQGLPMMRSSLSRCQGINVPSGTTSLRMDSPLTFNLGCYRLYFFLIKVGKVLTAGPNGGHLNFQCIY